MTSAEKLTNCFLAVFPGVPESEIPKSSTATVASWDSVATVTLLSMVAEEFNLDVDFDRFEEFTSFENLLRYVEESQRQN